MELSMLKRAAKLALRSVGWQATRSGEGYFVSTVRQQDGSRPASLLPCKSSPGDLQAAMDDVRRRWPSRDIVVLMDQPWPAPDRAHAALFCGRDAVSRIEEFDAGTTVFLYACESDDIGLPYVRSIVERRGIFFPIQVYTPSSYGHIDGKARTVLLTEHARQSEEGFGKFDFGFGDALNLMQAISVTSCLGGDYVEVGCFRGSSACVAMSYMRELGLRRTCYFLDVFEGFTYEAAKVSSDAMWAGSHETEGIATVEKRIVARTKASEGLNARVIKSNIIEDALPEQLKTVALANVDVDLYEAVLASLRQLAPRMVTGGIIVVEDPGHTPALIGSRLALQQFMDSSASQGLMPIYLESGQTFLVKTGSQSMSENA
jgi:hypothetical protein